MFGEYTIYKAKVVKISIPTNDGSTQRIIYISPLHHTGMGPISRDASPPSVLPTSNLGSGILSFPSIGQECLVAEFQGERHIISYTQPKNVSPYGIQAPTKLEEGTTIFRTAGLESAELRLDKYGGISMFSNNFAQVGVDGKLNLVYLKGYESKNEFAGGYQKHLYAKDTFQTRSQHVYTRFKDNPGFDDTRFRTEQTYETALPIGPGTYQYADKAIVRAGYIEGESIPYKIETRQGINQLNSYDKTVTTELRLGFQKEHTRWGNTTISSGSLFEFSGKKNFKRNVATYNVSIGKKSSNGELFGLEFKEGLNNGLPFGTPVSNPMGEGEGWGYNPGSTAAEYFSTSWGKFEDGSFVRNYMSTNYINSRFNFKELYGGDQLYTKEFNVDADSFKYVTMSKEVAAFTLIQRENFLFSDTIYNKTEDIGRSTKITKENGTYIQSILGENAFYREVYSNPLKLLEVLDDNSWRISVTEGNDVETFEISRKLIQLKSSDNVSITIEGEKISLKMKTSELVLTPEGLTYNDQPLVFGALVDFLLNNAGTFVQGVPPGSPAPLFPATLGKLNSQAPQPNTSPTALKTKV